MPHFRHKPRYTCSFCDKSQEDVRRLIAGPGAVYICDECVLGFQQEPAPTDSNAGGAYPGSHAGRPQRCSFCGKSKAESGDMFIHQSALGKGDVLICQECIELCIEILDEEEVSVSQPVHNAPTNDTQPPQHCTFCHKHLHEVRAFLSAADETFICNECVSLAHTLLQGQSARPDGTGDNIYGMFQLVRNPYMKHIVGISEIVLWVADKEASLRFYRDLLGLEVISPPELRNTFLRVGDGNAGIPQMIVLVPKTDEVVDKPEGFQLHHLALELPEDRFDLQHEALVQAGYQPRPGKHPVLPSRTMYVDDPDGNEVEFICRFGT